MGMPEYHDGSFGPIKLVEESLADLQGNLEEQARTKMLHIGKFEDVVSRAGKTSERGYSEPKAEIALQEIASLRMDVNRILIHLGINDKTKVRQGPGSGSLERGE